MLVQSNNFLFGKKSLIKSVSKSWNCKMKMYCYHCSRTPRSLTDLLVYSTPCRPTQASSAWPSTPTRGSPCTPCVAPSCTEARGVRRCHPTSSPSLTEHTSTCSPTTRTSLCWLRKYQNVNSSIVVPTTVDGFFAYFRSVTLHLKRDRPWSNNVSTRCIPK